MHNNAQLPSAAMHKTHGLFIKFLLFQVEICGLMGFCHAFLECRERPLPTMAHPGVYAFCDMGAT
jgi:hypothetical protein